MADSDRFVSVSMDAAGSGANHPAPGDGAKSEVDPFDAALPAPHAPGGASGTLAAAGGDAERGAGAGAGAFDGNSDDGSGDGDADDDFGGAVQSRRGQYARASGADDPGLVSNLPRSNAGTVMGAVPPHVWAMGGLFLVAIIIGIVVASTASRKHELFQNHVSDGGAVPAYDDKTLVRVVGAWVVWACVVQCGAKAVVAAGRGGGSRAT